MEEQEIFNTNYDVLFSGNCNRGPKNVIGPFSPEICRFCERSSPDVTFRNEAHAVSRLLGNRSLVVADECDACNALFARSLEDHLGKFTKPYRLMGRVHGKKGVPSYKTPKKLSRIDFFQDEGLVVENRPEDSIVEIDEAEGRIRINYVLERHIPSAVYKALVKIALSVMPYPDLGNFAHAKRWICHDDHSKPLLLPLILQFYFVPGPKPHRHTSVMVLKKKASSSEERFPHYLLLLAFGNVQYQIMVPSLADNRSSNGKVDLALPRFPSAFGTDWLYGPPIPQDIDLSNGEWVEPRTLVLSLHYDSAETLEC